MVMLWELRLSDRFKVSQFKRRSEPKFRMGVVGPNDQGRVFKWVICV